MKSLLLLLAVALVTDCRRHKTPRQHVEEFPEEQFDLRGVLRRKFAVTATLAQPEKSVICSPMSALLPLGKLALGADGATEQELLKVIGVSQRPELGQHFKDLLSRMSVLKGIHLDIASQVYIAEGKKLRSSFESKARDVFHGVGVQKMDTYDPTGTAKKINSWVYRQTHGKIEDLLSPDDISPGINVILVNAIYFSGKWAKPFGQPKDSEFFGVGGAVTIPMMSITDKFEYGENVPLNAQVIKIPYQKEEVFFYILLPVERDGLPKMLKKLKKDPELLNSSEMRFGQVELTIPKFKIETELDLGMLFKMIGLKEIFRSGISHMVQGEKVMVGKAIQKALIEVTEEGTTAAAASAVIQKLAEPTIFHADHPFLFYIFAAEQQVFAGTFYGK